MSINHPKFSFFNAKLNYLEYHILFENSEKKIILIGDLRHLKKDYEKISKKFKKLENIRIKDFFNLAKKYSGGFGLIILQNNVVNIFTNSNFSCLYYGLTDDRKLLVSDDFYFFGKYFKFKLNEKEFLHRYQNFLPSPLETVTSNVRIIPGYYSLKFNGYKIEGRSWVLDYYKYEDKDSINKNIYKSFEPWLKSLSEKGDNIYLLMSGGIDSTFLALILKEYGYKFTPICLLSKDKKGRIGCLFELFRSKAICKLLNLNLKILFLEPTEVANYFLENKLTLSWSNWIISPMSYKKLGIKKKDIIIDGISMDAMLNIEYTSRYKFFHLFILPRKIFAEYLHRMLLHIAYFISFFKRISLLNLIKSTGGGLLFPFPFVTIFKNSKRDFTQNKFFLRNFLRKNKYFFKLNCLIGLRIMRYYYFSVPVIRSRFLYLKSFYSIDMPATDGLVINKFLFRRSTLKDIFFPKWQLYKFFKEKYSQTYFSYMRRALEVEKSDFIQNLNLTKNQKSQFNIKDYQYFRSDFSNIDIIQKYIEDAKPQINKLIHQSENEKVKSILNNYISDRKDVFNPIYEFIYDIKRFIF